MQYDNTQYIYHHGLWIHLFWFDASINSESSKTAQITNNNSRLPTDSEIVLGRLRPQPNAMWSRHLRATSPCSPRTRSMSCSSSTLALSTLPSGWMQVNNLATKYIRVKYIYCTLELKMPANAKLNDKVTSPPQPKLNSVKKSKHSDIY